MIKTKRLLEVETDEGKDIVERANHFLGKEWLEFFNTQSEPFPLDPDLNYFGEGREFGERDGIKYNLVNEENNRIKEVASGETHAEALIGKEFLSRYEDKSEVKELYSSPIVNYFGEGRLWG